MGQKQLVPLASVLAPDVRYLLSESLFTTSAAP
jgi:hypothetical protein